LVNSFDLKFGWEIDSKKANFNQGIISATLILGMTVGALSGGMLMNIGRRRAQFVNITIGIVGISITMIFNYWSILIGRFLFGFCTGSFSSTVSRYIEETIPTHLFENL